MRRDGYKCLKGQSHVFIGLVSIEMDSVKRNIKCFFLNSARNPLLQHITDVREQNVIKVSSG